MLTIPTVAQMLGYPWDKKCIWNAGNRMQKWYFDQTGTKPDKQLRRKTNPAASGSHCIAVYGQEWLSDMEKICHQVHEERGVGPLIAPSSQA